jgi:hypothetical protein
VTSAHARLTHSIPGRARLRIAERKRDPSFFSELVGLLAECPAVRKVETSLLTGAVLIHHDGPFDAVAHHCERAGALTFDAPAPSGNGDRSVSSPAATAREQARYDPFNLATLAGVTLMALSALQAARGHLLGPASTVFFQGLNALSIAERSMQRRIQRR